MAKVLFQGFVLAKQVLYCLSHTSSPLCCGYFGDGSLLNCLFRQALNHDPPDLSFPSSLAVLGNFKQASFIPNGAKDFELYTNL
jgi:hypothetical protein